MNRIWLFLVLFLVQVSVVSAATIHGTVYNIDLNPVKNVKVELASPKQVFVATDGAYQFSVPTGTYTLTAKLIKNGTVDASTVEVITVTGDNEYVLDLILFPELGDDEVLTEADTLDIDEFDGDVSMLWLRIAIGLLIVGGVLWYFFRKQAVKVDEPHTQADTERVLKIIKDHGGRTTQKDIRKQLPLSEAKVSLIIAELEHKGHIEKIKQGRGNIIILK